MDQVLGSPILKILNFTLLLSSIQQILIKLLNQSQQDYSAY